MFYFFVVRNYWKILTKKWCDLNYILIGWWYHPGSKKSHSGTGSLVKRLKQQTHARASGALDKAAVIRREHGDCMKWCSAGLCAGGPTIFSEKSDVSDQNKRRVRPTLRLETWITRRIQLLFPGMRKILERLDIKWNIRSSVLHVIRYLSRNVE